MPVFEYRIESFHSRKVKKTSQPNSPRGKRRKYTGPGLEGEVQGYALARIVNPSLAQLVMLTQFDIIPLGDHTTFIGEVVDASNNNDKEPLAYYGGNYFIMNTPVEKPTQEERDTLREIVEKYKKQVTLLFP